MTRSRDLDPALVARFLSGECSAAEAALVQAWAAADPRHAAELDDMRRAWSSHFPLERPIDVDAAWQNVAASMHAGAPDEERASDTRAAHGPLRLERSHPLPSGTPVHVLRSIPRQQTARTRMMRLAGIAAAAGIAVAVSVQMLQRSRPGAASTASVPRTTRDFAAGPGQRAVIDLADGTHIVLAPATRLHVSLPTGATGAREATLDGEAMFTVTHDAKRPFTVRSRYGTTVDIGTSFAVQAYAGEPYRVIVRDGRVALGGTSAPVLVAGDVATRAADGTMHVAHAQNAAGLLDWTSGRLTFEHTRFADLVPELDRWYGVRIRIASPALRDRFITGQLGTESTSEAMTALGRALGAQHTTDGARVTFSLAGGAR